MSKTQLSIEKAAKLAAKSTKTIYRWIAVGKVTASVDANGYKRIELSELMRVANISQPVSDTETPARMTMPDHEKEIETLKLLLKEKDLRILELKEDKASLKDEKVKLTLLLEDKSKKRVGRLSGLLVKLGL